MKIERLTEIIEDGIKNGKAIELIAEEIKEELNDEMVWGEDAID